MKKNNNNLGVKILGAVVLIAVLYFAFSGSDAVMVKVDGSSTVFPITEAIAEEFGKENPDIQVPVGVSGTGGGFKKFCVGETDINDASRPVKDKEIKVCQENSIEFIELPVAYDGLSVVVNKDNNFAKSLTVDQLHRLWEEGSKIKTWEDLNSSWPDEEIKLYGPGTDSGTFDYFNEAIVEKPSIKDCVAAGKEKAVCKKEKDQIRSDFTKSEDDNVLVNGVNGSKYAMAFFGYAYYLENKDKLNVIAIDGGNGAVSPSETTINNGTYSPLSREIYIYVSRESAERDEVDSFITYYLDKAKDLVGEVGYIPLPDSRYDKAKEKFQNRETGVWVGE
jgi:phosphate transport system substrate-binding protein